MSSHVALCTYRVKEHEGEKFLGRLGRPPMEFPVVEQLDSA